MCFHTLASIRSTEPTRQNCFVSQIVQTIVVLLWGLVEKHSCPFLRYPQFFSADFILTPNLSRNIKYHILLTNGAFSWPTSCNTALLICFNKEFFCFFKYL